jgi:hypothetical protein
MPMKTGLGAVPHPATQKQQQGARTLDIQLGRLTLYQLSYTREVPCVGIDESF